MANRPDQPGDFPPGFFRYWTAGTGGQLIRWGVPGDFNRCRTAINAKIVEHGKAPLPDHEISGLCNKLHQATTGAAPGHAPGEEAVHAAKKAAKKAKH